MNTIELQYKRFTPDLREEQPVGRATLFLEGRSFHFVGIIDSGADYATISMRFLLTQGIRPEGLGSPAQTGCACGNRAFSTLLCAAELQVGEHRFPIKVCISNTEAPPLIGRQGVFDHFRIEFNQPEKRVLLRSI